jgi:putative glutamine amidotransferase
MLNVARGGTLIQDIPDALGTEIQHRQKEPGRIPTHAIVLEPGSRLEGAMGRQQNEVNSFHHQAADRLGRHLQAVAWAPDGVVEGLEAPDRDFVVAVQWHAESLAEREDQAGLFSAFVAAADRYAHAARRQEAA